MDIEKAGLDMANAKKEEEYKKQREQELIKSIMEKDVAEYSDEDINLLVRGGTQIKTLEELAKEERENEPIQMRFRCYHSGEILLAQPLDEDDAGRDHFGIIPGEIKEDFICAVTPERARQIALLNHLIENGSTKIKIDDLPEFQNYKKGNQRQEK